MNIKATAIYAGAILFLVIGLFNQQIIIDADSELALYVKRVKFTHMAIFSFIIVANEGDLLMIQERIGKFRFFKRMISVLCFMHIVSIAANSYTSKYYYWLTGAILLLLVIYLVSR